MKRLKRPAGGRGVLAPWRRTCCGSAHTCNHVAAQRAAPAAAAGPDLGHGGAAGAGAGVAGVLHVCAGRPAGDGAAAGAGGGCAAANSFRFHVCRSLLVSCTGSPDLHGCGRPAGGRRGSWGGWRVCSCTCWPFDPCSHSCWCDVECTGRQAGEADAAVGTSGRCADALCMSTALEPVVLEDRLATARQLGQVPSVYASCAIALIGVLLMFSRVLLCIAPVRVLSGKQLMCSKSPSLNLCRRP